ncbi:hypothetical protein DFH07DRAFT_783005 [Mycena maculata]|uniref:Uncharacterized protein n=1 Tax=Mycena maculata TaxID=230809 RepID=A0AAD7HPQ3_9AGAR|nr:hypothetical protein DFH07DRAFT_783005 [Mycena maculata]
MVIESFGLEREAGQSTCAWDPSERYPLIQQHCPVQEALPNALGSTAAAGARGGPATRMKAEGWPIVVMTPILQRQKHRVITCPNTIMIRSTIRQSDVPAHQNDDERPVPLHVAGAHSYYTPPEQQLCGCKGRQNFGDFGWRKGGATAPPPA